jgi:hypothetical protein
MRAGSSAPAGGGAALAGATGATTPRARPMGRRDGQTPSISGSACSGVTRAMEDSSRTLPGHECVASQAWALASRCFGAMRWPTA